MARFSLFGALWLVPYLALPQGSTGRVDPLSLQKVRVPCSLPMQPHPYGRSSSRPVKPRPPYGRLVSLRGGFRTQDAFDRISRAVNALGPGAPFGFGCAYIGCELLSVPPAPLAACAGAIFGFVAGTALVLLSGLVSAAISFHVGRSLRSRFHNSMKDRRGFIALDRIITKGGFRAVLLLRLIPTPVPAINYLYGVTGLKFNTYILATFLGYLPGTLALVYSGVFGKDLAMNGLQQPWFIYVGAAALLVAVCKLGLDMAKTTIAELSQDEDGR